MDKFLLRLGINDLGRDQVIGILKSYGFDVKDSDTTLELRGTLEEAIWDGRIPEMAVYDLLIPEDDLYDDETGLPRES